MEISFQLKRQIDKTIGNYAKALKGNIFSVFMKGQYNRAVVWKEECAYT